MHIGQGRGQKTHPGTMNNAFEKKSQKTQKKRKKALFCP
jgi:hypothetical protein